MTACTCDSSYANKFSIRKRMRKDNSLFPGKVAGKTDKWDHQDNNIENSI